MAIPFGVTTTPADHIELKYRREFYKEYVRNSGFKPYMGVASAGLLKPIHIMLENKKGGQTTRIPLLTKLRNRGTAGSSTLVGREEPLGKYSFNCKIEWRRHAVATEEKDEHYSFVKVVDEVRPLLKQYCEEQVRDEIIDGLAMVKSNAPGTADEVIGVPLCNPDAPDAPIKNSALAATLNTWMDHNVDRVLFGHDGVVNPAAAGTNRVAGNFAGSLANITAPEKFGAQMVMRMKYLARHADPLIRPIRIGEGGREFYVCFTDSDSFDQAWTDTDIKAANMEARAREGDAMEKNPIFQDGDLIYRGVIIREIPEIKRIDKAQYTTTVDICRQYLMGAQALAFSWGMEPDFRKRKEDDYGHINGVGVTEARGCQKIQFELPVDFSAPAGAKRKIDFGMVTGFSGHSV